MCQPIITKKITIKKIIIGLDVKESSLIKTVFQENYWIAKFAIVLYVKDGPFDGVYYVTSPLLSVRDDCENLKWLSEIINKMNQLVQLSNSKSKRENLKSVVSDCSQLVTANRSKRQNSYSQLLTANSCLTLFDL